MKSISRWMSLIGIAGMTAMVAAACGDSGSTESTSSGGGGGGTGPTNAEIAPVAENYSDNIHENYETVLAKLGALKTAVDNFVDDPTAETQQAAKDAWNDARPAYLQSEVYRFYNGPIDNEATGPEGRINGWPLDENYIDYTVDDPNAGIINDTEGFPEITKEVIKEANEKVNEKSLSAGYHAVEFLLWGQDLNAKPTDAGLRSFTDYLPEADGGRANYDRRGQYLQAAVELMIDDLTPVEDAWHPDEENFRKDFLADPKLALTDMLTGMGALAGGELKNERINNAYQERDQEEEHSCFSDTTHIDHLNDALGIENVYLGRYGDNDGPGIDDLVKKVDPALDEEMKTNLTAAIEAIKAIPHPFDQAIQDDSAGGGREKIKAAMDALQKVTDTTVKVATALDVTLNLE